MQGGICSRSACIVMKARARVEGSAVPCHTKRKEIIGPEEEQADS